MHNWRYVQREIFISKYYILVLLIMSAYTWISEYNKHLEETLLKSYNRKHRPVKKESTTVQIQIYLLIGHIEKVVRTCFFYANFFIANSLAIIFIIEKS